jgi:outer membrane protein OmpA-like peptidoglycan-associated protein
MARMSVALRAVAGSLSLAAVAACASGPPPAADLAATPPSVIGEGQRSGAGGQARDEGSAADTEPQRLQAASLDKSQADAARPVREAEPDRQPVLDAQRLQSQLTDMQAKQTPRGMVVTIGNVLFKTNSAELLPAASAGLDRLAAYLSASAGTVHVEGYTDSSSSTAYNIGLSQRRADSVRQALLARGVDPAKIDSRGYGDSAPVASNDTAEGRQMNRRVEVVIAAPDGEPPQASGTTD